MPNDWENWDEPACCPHCGEPTDYERCDQCEDGEIDVYELDPLWYDPGDTEPCAQCLGAGGWYWCYNAQCPAKLEAA
jgi:hypothetical protein